jgi:hypothetical protein
MKHKSIRGVSQKTIIVAVWWPGEGYGGGTKCRDHAHAVCEVVRLFGMGYGKPRCPVRIITSSSRVEEFEVTDEKDHDFD